MMQWLDLEGTGRRALASNIGWPVLAGLALLAGMDALDLPFERARTETRALVLQVIWLLLFATLGAARWQLTREAESGWLSHWRRGLEAWEARRWLGRLMLLCLLHPLATWLFPGPSWSWMGPLLALGFASLVFWKAVVIHWLSAMQVLPVILWMGLAKAM